MTNTVYGLGADGYIGLQIEKYSNKETHFKTLPVNFESFIKYYRENIENKNLLGKRSKTKNNLGYEIIEGQIIMDCYPTLVGYFLILLLGDPVTVRTVVTTDTYKHTWKQMLNPDHELRLFMIQQAFGFEKPEQFNHCVFNGLTLECEKGSNLKMTLPVSHGQLSTSSLERTTIFQYPAESPYNWSNISISEKSLGGLNVHSFSFNIDLNYRKNEFFLGSSKENIPVLNGIPVISLNLNVDADKKFIDLARENKYCDFEINIESNLIITDGHSNVHAIKLNLPSCQLNPQTTLEHSEERLTMDLEFDCSFLSSNNDSIFQFEVDDGNENYL